MRVCLIPAAGASSRMRGGDKLLEDVDGTPCLRVLADRAEVAGAHVVVALPAPHHPRTRALAGSSALRVYVPNAALGLSETLKTGLAAVPRMAHGVMILPADMPDITARDMARLWEVFERDSPQVLRATNAAGHDGHPVIFGAEALGLFETLSGDQGAMRVLKSGGLQMSRHPLEGTRATLDLDTPEDWAAWRQSRGT